MESIKVPKDIKKSDLYQYTEMLHRKRVAELREEYPPKLDELKMQILKELQLDSAAADEMITLSRTVNTRLLYEAAGHDYELNSLRSIPAIRGTASGLITNNLNSRQRNIQKLSWREIEEGSPLIKMVEKWDGIVESYNDQEIQSRKLRRELDAIVKSERRAPNAFKKLYELGLDMKHLQPEKSSVPALITTSVSLDIYNNLKVNDEDSE